MLKIGLTGGIGSGKTTVAKLFEWLGIPVYYSDIHAKRLTNEDPNIRKAIIEVFGPETYKDEVLDRPYLGNIVFNDKTKLQQLNDIVHPVLNKDLDEWFDNQSTAYAIEEAAIILDLNLQDKFDAIIGVFAPMDLRIERLLKRDNTSLESIQARIQSQMSDEDKRSHCQYQIENDGTDLTSQVQHIHRLLVARAKLAIKLQNKPWSRRRK